MGGRAPRIAARLEVAGQPVAGALDSRATGALGLQTQDQRALQRRLRGLRFTVRMRAHRLQGARMLRRVSCGFGERTSALQPGQRRRLVTGDVEQMRRPQQRLRRDLARLGDRAQRLAQGPALGDSAPQPQGFECVHGIVHGRQPGRRQQQCTQRVGAAGRAPVPGRQSLRLQLRSAGEVGGQPLVQLLAGAVGTQHLARDALAQPGVCE